MLISWTHDRVFQDIEANGTDEVSIDGGRKSLLVVTRRRHIFHANLIS